jgi:hypothetical protein
MVKKCSPGVVCIENMTMFMIIMIIIGLFMYLYKHQTKTVYEKVIIDNQPSPPHNLYYPHLSRPNYSFTNTPNDVLMNPYEAPMRDNRYLNHTGGIPINISTQGVDTNYRQVGILNRINGKEEILPLMGRPLLSNRDKWQFYTMNSNNIKLPLSNKGRSCTNEHGCDNLYNGDTVYVEGYNDAFKVTAYDNNVMKYIPFI